MEIMEKEVIECMEKAEKKKDTSMSYVIKSNGLKRKNKETKKNVENESLDLEARKKKLSTCPCKCIIVLCFKDDEQISLRNFSLNSMNSNNETFIGCFLK